MSSHKDDLDLLLSLRERVLDTPPGSPSPHSPGYLSEDRSPRRSEKSDMSVFRDAVRDFLDYEYKPVHKAGKLKGSKASNYTELEKFSGLRIRNRLVSAAELSELFSDVCFVQLSTMKNLLVGDTLPGCWATVGVLTEKGTSKTSSTGKNYCIWKVGCLDDKYRFSFLVRLCLSEELERAGWNSLCIVQLCRTQGCSGYRVFSECVFSYSNFKDWNCSSLWSL